MYLVQTILVTGNALILMAILGEKLTLLTQSLMFFFGLTQEKAN